MTAAAEVEHMRDRIAELEAVLGIKPAQPIAALLRPRFKGSYYLAALEPLLGMLLARELVSREAAYVGIYGARPEADQPDPGIIPVLLVRLRFGLKPYGITIQNVHGRGWFLSLADKAKLRALLEAVPA